MRINLFKINWTRLVLVSLILILLCLNYVQCEHNKTSLSNIDALNSEISTYKLSNGELVASQRILQFDKNQLEDLVISKDAELEEMYKNFSKPKLLLK